MAEQPSTSTLLVPSPVLLHKLRLPLLTTLLWNQPLLEKNKNIIEHVAFLFPPSTAACLQMGGERAGRIAVHLDELSEINLGKRVNYTPILLLECITIASYPDYSQMMRLEVQSC